jgi:hypothetical protein
MPTAICPSLWFPPGVENGDWRSDPGRINAARAQRSISPTSLLYFELNGTLRELRGAATAMRVFAEYIQRNPSAFVVGK